MPAEQETLGDQLAVGIDDESARDPEVGGEHPGRRQPGVRRQAAGADRVTQTVGELVVHGSGAALSSSTSSSGPEVVPEIVT
ncbi:MAG: hypothetical protein ACXWZR_09200 [Mycobacterium sp.]